MNQEQEIKPTIIYSSYTDAQKRATQKYRVANKDKVNERRKAYYQQRKGKDPEFLKYKREKAREYYQRKKEKVDVKECIDLINTTCEAMDKGEIFEPVIEPVIETTIEPVIETVIVKPRRTYKKAMKKIVDDLVKENLEEVKPIIEEEVIIEPTMSTKVKKPRTIKAKPTKGDVHSTEVVGIVHDGAILKLQINGEDFVFQHDPTKAIKDDEPKTPRKRVNMAKFAKKI
jgi:hypothetical protein